MTSTIPTIAVTVSLAASALLADIASVAEFSQDILFQEPNALTSVTGHGERPIIISGYPKPEEQEDLNVSLYRIGMAHYNFLIVTAIVVATDKKAAVEKANIVWREMNVMALQRYPQNGDWKLHTFDDPISNDEVFELSQTAQVFLTIC